MQKLVVAIIIFIMTLYASIFIVKESERGIVLHLGKVLRDAENKPFIYKPGLHFKIPLIEIVKVFDSRIQTISDQSHFMTKEKQDLTIDSYIKWRITDFYRYYLTTGKEGNSQAAILLKQKYSDYLRHEIAKLNIKDIIRNSHEYLTLNVRNALNFGRYNVIKNNEKIIKEEDDIDTESLKDNWIKLNKKALLFNSENMFVRLGIEVIDVRIKQISLSEKILETIYKRMRVEQKLIADCLRAQGKEKAEKLRTAADYEMTKILAEARKEERLLRGEGDAESIKLFSNAFSQEKEFYSFIRGLHAYENSFQNSQNIIILKLNDNYFLRHMKAPGMGRHIGFG